MFYKFSYTKFIEIFQKLLDYPGNLLKVDYPLFLAVGQ